MKEILEKFFKLFSEGVNKISEDQEEGLKKLAEASEMSKDILAKVEEENAEEAENQAPAETPTKAEEPKAEENAQTPEQTDLNKIQEQIKSLSDKFDALAKEKSEDDETVTKALDNALDRLEIIEKTLDTTVSKQI